MPYKNPEDRKARDLERRDLLVDSNYVRYHFGGKKKKMAEWYAANSEKRRAYKKRYYEKNRERILEEGVQKRKANPELGKRKHLKRRYGITPEEKQAMLTLQGNRCAICGVIEPGIGGWHLDHCHASQQIRGILCYACNNGLGMFRDSPQQLRAAANYLEKLDDPSTNID